MPKALWSLSIAHYILVDREEKKGKFRSLQELLNYMMELEIMEAIS